MITEDEMDSQALKDAWEDWLEEENLTFGERVADKVAEFGGSWWFILLFFLALAIWVLFNLRGNHFDPYPFILLNLVLSTLAAIQAPIIMMSQNRQEKRDRERAMLDFKLSRQAERDIIVSLRKEIRLMRREQADLAQLVQSQQVKEDQERTASPPT